MTLLAVDGHHNLHRILHVPAFQSFSARGMPTGGLYGGLVTVRAALENFNARSCVMVWDSPLHTFRQTVLRDYKANRIPKTNEEREEKEKHRILFFSQKKLLTRALSLLGCRILEVSGAEGDDLLFLLTKIRCAQIKMILMSEDMDLAQLVDSDISLWRPGKEEMLNLANFESVTGVKKCNFVLKKAIMGDSSDNITGIRGVGEKRVREHTVLREFRDYCAKHTSVPIRRIADDFSTVTRNLVAMDLSNFPWTIEDIQRIREELNKPHIFEPAKARAMFKQLEFDSLLSNFSAWVQPFRMLR